MRALSIKSALMLGVAGLLGLGMASGGAGFIGAQGIANELDYAETNTIPSLVALGSIKSDMHAIDAMIGAHILAATPEATKVIDEKLQTEMAALESNIEAYEPLLSDDAERALFADLKSSWAAFKRDVGPLRRASLALQTQSATDLFNGQVRKSTEVFVAAADKQIEYNAELAEAAGVRGEAAKTNAALSASLLALLSLLGAGAIFMLVLQRVIRPMASLRDDMGRLAGGQNQITVSGTGKTDEIGAMARAVEVFRQNALERIAMEARVEQEKRDAEQRRKESELAAQAAAETLVVESFGEGMQRLAAGDMTYRLNRDLPVAYRKLQSDFNDAMQKVQTALRSVVTTTHTIHGGSSEVSQAANNLSQRTEQQAANLEQTAAALDEITATVRRMAEGAVNAGQIVENARADALSSGDIVSNAVAAMGSIEKSANEISQIIGVIDEIAFQTNLLALNAGVEAARAGDAGRGFAVVASEVRALAQRSADAAKQIKGLISTSTREVAQGVQLVDSTGVALDRIVKQVSEINEVVQQFVSSTQEQATALAQVNTAVNQMDQMTQQNAALVEQSAAAAESLKGQAARLSELVSLFRLQRDANYVH